MRGRTRAERTLLQVCAFILLLSLIAPHSVQAGGQTVRIGVLACRGKERAIEMWSQTAQDLSRRIPQRSFSIA